MENTFQQNQDVSQESSRRHADWEIQTTYNRRTQPEGHQEMHPGRKETDPEETAPEKEVKENLIA